MGVWGWGGGRLARVGLVIVWYIVVHGVVLVEVGVVVVGRSGGGMGSRLHLVLCTV